MIMQTSLITLLAGVAFCACAQAAPQPAPADITTRNIPHDYNPGPAIGGNENGGRIVVPPMIPITPNVKVGGGIDFNTLPGPAQITGGQVGVEIHY